jgi:TonB family protein
MGRGSERFRRMLLVSFLTHVVLITLAFGAGLVGNRGNSSGQDAFPVMLIAPASELLPAPKESHRISPSPPPPPPPRRAPVRTSRAVEPKYDPDRMEDWWKKHKPTVKLPDPLARGKIASADKKIEAPPSVLPGRRDLKEKTDRESTPYWSKDSTTQGKSPPEAPDREASKTPETTRKAAPTVSVEGGKGGNPYNSVVERKITENWKNPLIDSAERELAVEIVFYIHEDGSISGARVDKESGNSFFDAAALRAVLLARHFPPLSGWYEEPAVLFHVRFGVGELS